MSDSKVSKHIELVQTLLSSQKDRALYLINPKAYMQSLSFEVDEQVSAEIDTAITSLEKEFSKVGLANPFIAEDKGMKPLLEQD
ncbi:hypothetical protein, partial [Vibrio parahaemolyticus]